MKINLSLKSQANALGAAIAVSDIETCLNCGETSTDVQRHLEWLGGSGIILTPPQCNDSVACWSRYDKANGIEVACLDRGRG